ncbi:SBBP repeat-containing protein [Methanococcus maripaludis]|uniref:Beta-propeller repeat protein n=1 Tax=Methanococcus maripaludis TaxID=39152 RepID=A0A7J9S1C5_METMI|nr:SBBP repeat-containing protein [Methanococcus maripaludis]MBB6066512.1 hypothetical protein [Methanococcus maripaludis]
MKNKYIILGVFLLLIGINLINAEELLWNNSYDYASGTDQAYSIAVDKFGNSYVAGYGDDGNYSWDILVLKYDTDGNLLWNNSYDYASDFDFAEDIAVDKFGNSYILGYGVKDYDSDLLIIKYDTDGNLLWNNSYDYALSSDYSKAIALDKLGNVYVTGYGAGGTYWDMLILKYDTDGNLLWNNSYDYDHDADYPEAIAVDKFGNSYVAGYGVTGYMCDILVLKYDTDGNLLWNNSYDCASSNEGAFSIALDKFGNAYVTGYGDAGDYSWDILTLKYDKDGNLLWNNSYDYASNDDYAGYIAVDKFGNSYILGYGYGEYTSDILIIKYDKDGNLLWNNSYDYASNDDSAFSIALDKFGNVYIAGYGDAGDYSQDMLILKYDTGGNLLWNDSYDYASGGDIAYAIALDKFRSVYVTGYGDAGDYSWDILILKYG